MEKKGCMIFLVFVRYTIYDWISVFSRYFRCRRGKFSKLFGLGTR